MTSSINLLFVPYHNSGGHFLDWSIRYVCGQLPSDTDVADWSSRRNWHHHDSIMVGGFQALQHRCTELRQHSPRDFENIYALPLSLTAAVHQLHGLRIDQSSHQQRQEAVRHIHADTTEMLTWAQDHGLVPVIIGYAALDWYSVVYNNRSVQDLEGRPLQDQHQVFDQYLDCFFDQARQRWDQDTVWDRREMLALIWRFDQLPLHLDQVYDAQRPHLRYDTDDVWNNLPAVLQEICLELDLAIDHTRLQHWHSVYQQWRELHDPYFGRHLDRIIDAILHNKYLSLKRFRMGFWHEVLIQNQLLIKHRLNLRTWQLEKFPDNTQELHQLLEPSTHMI